MTISGAADRVRARYSIMVLNLANTLTLLRIAAIPLVVAAFWLDKPWAQWVAMVLFGAASVTDWFDGYFARRYAQISRFGRFLDPIADKLLVVAALVMLVADGPLKGVHLLAALIILAREILVSGLREFLAEIRVGLPVSQLAKWKTAIQMTAIAVLLLNDAGPKWLQVGPIGVHELGLILIWIAAALTLVTGYDYLRAGLAHMGDEPKPGE
jgi:cardiolipin synthase